MKSEEEGDLRRLLVSAPGDVGAERWSEFAAHLHPQRLAKVVRWMRTAVRGPLYDRFRSDTFRFLMGRVTRADVLKSPKFANTKRLDRVSVKYGAFEKAISEFALKVFKSNDFIHEPQVVRYLYGNADHRCLFVDVGAHFGYFSCFVAALGGTVIAVELQRTLCLNIEANCLLNDQWRVHVLCAAAGSAPGLTQVDRLDPSPGKQAIAESVRQFDYALSSVNHELVPVVTLDSLVGSRAAAEFGKVIIKIDIEGAEVVALKGAQRIIAERRAIFLVEIHSIHLRTFGGTVEDVLDHFPEASWTMTLMAEDRETAMTRRELLAAVMADTTGINPCVRFEPRR